MKTRLKENLTFQEVLSLNSFDPSRLMENHIRCSHLFRSSRLMENDSGKSQSVIDALEANDWEEKDASKFRTALMKSKHKEMLTNYSVDELSKMKLFKLKGYDIGFALKKKGSKYNEIVAVFNNESDVKGIGKELMLAAIKNGGCYLDHYDGFLSNLYSSLGFNEYKRYKFDPQYDKDGSFKKKYGEADVIFRKHKDCR
jgi:hypothetical protein